MLDLLDDEITMHEQPVASGGRIVTFRMYCPPGFHPLYPELDRNDDNEPEECA